MGLFFCHRFERSFDSSRRHLVLTALRVKAHVFRIEAQAQIPERPIFLLGDLQYPVAFRQILIIEVQQQYGVGVLLKLA